jgi:hypothetical protein
VPLDCTYRLRIPHKAGQLAKVSGAIAETRGLIGDITTVSVARKEAIREITVEVRDKTHMEDLATRLGALEGVSVIWFHDRAFLAHDGGKLDVVSRREIRTNQDVRDVYTPGVARVSLAISEFPDLAGRFTMIGRSVAICTNGTRVLGLGDIGPVASMPVMEGKALFYAQLAGLAAVPILIDTKDVDEFVETVVRIAPGFGGIHLEDISAPGVLRDRAAADRGAPPAGDARRRPRHRGGDARRGDRRLPRGGPAPRRGDRRADRPGRRGLRHRDAHPRRRRRAGPWVGSQPGRAGDGARARDRDRVVGAADGRGRRGGRHQRPAGLIDRGWSATAR